MFRFFIALFGVLFPLLSFGATVDLRLTNYSVNGSTMTVDLEAQASSAFVLGGSDVFGSPSLFFVTYTNRGSGSGQVLVQGVTNTPTDYSIIPADFQNGANGVLRISMQISNSASFTIPTSYTRIATISFTLGAGTTSSHTITLNIPTNTTVYDENDVTQTDGSFTGLSNQQLPVTLQSFDLVRYGSFVELNWTTSTEENNEGFELQRSHDGVVYETIGWVNGSGNSITAIDYTFNDLNADFSRSSTIFYRIKQIDFNGDFSYSIVRSIEINIESTISWFPNPAKEKIVVNTNESTLIEVIDMTGRTVLNTNNLESNSIDVSTLEKGTYIMLIRNLQGEILSQDKLHIN